MNNKFAKAIFALKMIGIIYAGITLMVTIVYGVNLFFVRDSFYPEIDQALEDLVQNLWMFPFMAVIFTMLGGSMIYPILIIEAKKINRTEKLWTCPVVLANIIIAVLAIIPGGFITGFIGDMFQIPGGPWNIVPAVIFGSLFLKLLHGILKKISAANLEFFTRKCFG